LAVSPSSNHQLFDLILKAAIALGIIPEGVVVVMAQEKSSYQGKLGWKMFAENLLRKRL